MLLVAPLLLALVAVVNAQKSITWTQQLPKGFVLIKGDELSLPIDEYVSLSSAIITASDPTRNIIVPKIQVVKEAKSSQGNNMQACSLADNTREQFAIYVCNKNLIRIEKDDSFMMENADKAKTVPLITPAGAVPALKDSSTTCTDMFSLNGKYLISCYDTTNLTNPNYIFNVGETLDTAVTPITIGTCDTGDIKGDSRIAKLMTSSNKNALLFYDVSRVASSTPGVINTPYCNLDVSQQFTKSPSTANNLFTIINNQSLSKGVLKHIASWTATDLLAIIAVDDGAVKTLFFVPLMINDMGNITAHTSYNISQWNGTGVAGFNPNFMTFVKTSGTNQYVASDKSNLYSFTFHANMTLASEPWSVVLDCGLASKAAFYISKIEISGGNGDITNPASRTLITYSTVDSKKVKEFAVHINNTKFACSRATTAADASKLDTVNTVGFTSEGWLMVSHDSKLSRARINYNTMLTIAISEETAAKSVDLSVSMEEWTSPVPQKFEYKSLRNSQDHSEISLGSKTFKTYTNVSSYLNIPAYSFFGNNPTISSTSPNVQLRYSSSNSLALSALNISDYDIHRIVAVDEDTFVAVLRKPNAPEAFVRFWNKWDGSKATLDAVNSSITVLAQRQILFKMFKLGPKVFCAVFKSNGPAAKKLTFSCYDDVKEAPVRADANMTIITDTFEVSDIQVQESDSRVDLFMVGTATAIKDSAVLHFYLTIGSDNKIMAPAADYVQKIDITHKDLPDYYPTDIVYDVWGDSESTNYVTIKQVSKFNLRPVVSKYNVSASTSPTTPPKLTYIYHMYIPSQDMAFCAIKNEIIFYSPKTKQILVNKMIRVPTGVTLPQNKLYLPVRDYGIDYLQQFNCIPEKGIFQVLGVAKDKKFLVNFRAGDSTNGARRVHSVVPVATTASFLETAFNNDFIVSVVSSQGKGEVARNIVYTYYDGPKFIVNNLNVKDNYDVTISSTSQSTSTSQAVVKVEIISPKFKAELKPNKTFQITSGATIFLEDVATIEGPVMDIKLEGADATKVKLIKRNNKHRGYTAGETTTADRIYAEEDFMALVWTGSKLKILGDPSITKTNGTSPQEVLTESALNIREAAMVRYGKDGEAVLVTRTYLDTTYRYNIYHLLRAPGVAPVNYTYTVVKSDALFTTTMDYDSLQVTSIGNTDVVIALKMKRAFNSNTIRLVSFSKTTGNKFVFKASTILTVDSSKEIGGHTLSYDGKDRAVIVAFYKDYDYLIYATWDGKAASSMFRQSATKYKLSDSETVSLFISFIRCWVGTAAGTLECLIDASGIVDYLVTITPEPTQRGELDPILSIVKTAEFEMPPGFEVKRTDRGKEHYGFLMKKSPLNVETPSTRRVLQEQLALDKFSDCENIMIFFKPKSGRFIYTGITCSEWGKNSNVDFAMEFDTNDYIYLTKYPAAAPPARRILQTSANDRVGANFLAPIQIIVNGQVDPNLVKINFLGLNGPNDPTSNPSVTLNDFKQGAPPAPAPASTGSSFWTWFIIILVIILIIGGAVYGYIWYQNNQSSSTSSSYTKQVNRDTSKSDLEDTRL